MSSSDIDREASEWLVRLDRDCEERTRSEFELWYAADARHQAAYLRQLETWDRLDRLHALSARPDVARRVEQKASSYTWLKRAARRPLWASVWAAAAAVIAGMVYFLQLTSPGVELKQEYATDVGGFERVVLPDGSIIEINTDSQLRAVFERDRRLIELDRGEATFIVEHDVSRPFVVVTGATVVRAVGTRFNVRRRERSTEVTVVDGSVALGTTEMLAASGAVLQPTTPVLGAGSIAIADSGGLRLREVPEAEVSRTLAWRDGMLSFSGETLADAAEEFNRYNRRKLVVADDSVADLRIGGMFRATNVDTFAAVLEARFGVQVDAQAERIVLRRSQMSRDLSHQERGSAD